MKKTLLTILQLLVTGALLYWVFHDPKVREGMAVAIREADYRWIGAAIMAYLCVELAAVVRWQILLRVQGINLGKGRVIALFLIGMFYNQFLPGGTGGDIVKTYLLWKETPDKKSGGLLAVLFDRMIGLIALIVITAVLVFLRYRWLTSTPATSPYVWLLLAIFGSSALFVVTTFVISGFGLMHKLPHRFPGRDRLIEITAAYHLYARHWRATAAAFGASIVCHLATFATFLCVAYAFRAVISPVDFFAIMPIERTISSLPISFAGVGTREYILQIMLSNLCAVPPGAAPDYWFAVARLIGLTGFTVILVCCLPGGIVYFFYRPSGATGHVKMRDMQKEFATLEHEITEREE
ncbi:MAG TPA: lysylphosphatidylglycerol synthase transmembrane domain-containing protein [Chthoniobacterales bacterium]|nr:lysylphosphatidylglycerol synthase transmembrane domain-containing protein [Chthoniobacterales bacterium]